MGGPLRRWKCDQCGEFIREANDGLVTWCTDEDGGAHSFRIVHRKTCDVASESPWSWRLDDCLGVNGLTRLLSMLSAGPLMVNDGQRLINNMDEFVDVVRRVQIPYYEEARPNFCFPDQIEGSDDVNGIAPYLFDRLRQTAEIDAEAIR